MLAKIFKFKKNNIYIYIYKVFIKMHIFNIFYYNKEYFWTNLQYFIFIHNIFALFIKRWLTLDYFFWVHCNTFTNIYKVKAFSIFDSVKKKNYLTKTWMINTMYTTKESIWLLGAPGMQTQTQRFTWKT
jgi:hypothetical protein